MISQQNIQAENKFSYSFPPRNLVEAFLFLVSFIVFLVCRRKVHTICAESKSTKCLWGALMMVFIFTRFTINTSVPKIYSPLISTNYHPNLRR